MRLLVETYHTCHTYGNIEIPNFIPRAISNERAVYSIRKINRSQFRRKVFRGERIDLRQCLRISSAVSARGNSPVMF